MPLPTSASASVASLLPTSPRAVTFIFASHSRWPLPPSTRSTAPGPSNLPSPLRISCLDSSFNPPTAAHLALASRGSADACLLVYSAQNCDKGTAHAGEVARRLAFVREVALYMQERAEKEGREANVAVALLNAPAFVDKSRALKEELGRMMGELGEEGVETRLSFSVGWDTLIRIFDPKWYSSLQDSMRAFLEEDGSSLVCARRGDISREQERGFLESDNVRPWREKVEMFDLEDEKLKGMSSTEVRKAVKEGWWDDVRRYVPFEGVVEVLRQEAQASKE
ncbi:hypothetical protein JCM8547_002209 [Rhodosporidiobolus lusitaniae]